MIQDPDEIPDDAVVSAGKKPHKLTVFHTDEDCPYYPEDTRPATWDDVRASVRECTRCATLGFGVPEKEDGG